MKYKYRLTENREEAEDFQKQRIIAFDGIEAKLDTLKKRVRKAKLKTISYYNANPDSFDVLYSTDLLNDYLKDIFTLFKEKE